MNYLFEGLALDTERRELRRGANLIPVEPQVFDLLEYLIRNRARVVSKEDVFAAVWHGRIVSDSALTSRINSARSAIADTGDDQRLIRTLRGKGFRFVGAVQEEQPSADTPRSATPVERSNLPLPLPDRPSIAVPPFKNMSGDPEQEYFADGIVEDIITELSRFSELFVIARNSSFQYKGKAVDVRLVGRELGVRYVLEGRVRRGGDRLRISAQLIDAATGAHRWAEHYDRKLEDVFAVQDKVVRTIVAILAAHVRKAEAERTRAKPPNSWQAYDYYLQAADAHATFLSLFSVEDLYETRRLLQCSLAIDANYARSYALLAHTHEAAWVNPWDNEFLNPDALDLAHQFARKAVQFDQNLPLAHACLGLILTWKGEHDVSMAEFERAIALNPNYVDWRFGLTLVLAGHSRRAVDVLEAYTRLDPFYSPLASAILGFAHYMLEQYSQALPVLRDCVSRAPNLRAGHSWLAATYAQLGQLEEARAEAAEVLRVQPNYTIAGTQRRLMAFKCAKDGKHFFDGLRRAGLPEEEQRTPHSAIAVEPSNLLLPLPDRPSIAVLPFTNMSGDPEQEYFVDGIAEDLITELSRFRSLFVIARNSSFFYKGRSIRVQDVARDLGVRYLAEGSVRKAGKRVRITAQLVDATSGNHVWAQYFDRDVEDVFAVQNEVVQSIVAVLTRRLEAADLDRVNRKPASLMSYDYVLRAKHHHHRVTEEDNARALQMVEIALTLDANHAQARAWLACILGQAMIRGFIPQSERNFRRAFEAAETARSLDDNDAECHRILCEIHLIRRDYDRAQYHQERALSLNPNDPRMVAQRGHLLT